MAYFSHSFLLNNLIYCFPSSGKVPHTLCGLALGSSPPKSSQLPPASVCGSPCYACQPTLCVLLSTKVITPFYSCACPISFCSTYVPHVTCPRVLPMCKAMSSSRNTVTFLHHHSPCTQVSSWYSKCLLNE